VNDEMMTMRKKRMRKKRKRRRKHDVAKIVMSMMMN
jgi:hypothetical protein